MIEKILMISILVIGALLIFYSLKMAKTVDECNSVNATRSIRGMLVTGTALISIAMTHIACACCGIKTFGFKLRTFVSIVVLLMGIISTTLLSIVHNDCEGVRPDTSVLLPFTSGAIVLSGIYLALSFLMISKKSGEISV